MTQIVNMKSSDKEVVQLN